MSTNNDLKTFLLENRIIREYIAWTNKNRRKNNYVPPECIISTDCGYLIKITASSSRTDFAKYSGNVNLNSLN
jgi:hypothetical protein